MKRLIRRNLIVAFIGLVIGVASNEALSGKRLRKSIRKTEDDLQKFDEFYCILLQWVRVRQEGRSLVEYFTKNNYRTVAIYGMRELGEALFEELNDSPIEVKFAIDRNADAIFAGIDVYTPDEIPEEIDVVVVTAVHFFDEIEQDLKQRIQGKIVSLEDVVWEA